LEEDKTGKLEEDKTGKLIIYCDNIEKCQVITDEVADEVERQIYNAQIGNEELKKKGLKRMRERDDRVWIATNASRVNFDMPDVRVAIHIGLKNKSRD